MLSGPDRKALARFFSHVDIQPRGRWLWIGALHAGYGTFYWDGASQGAHRVSHEWFVGPIPWLYQVDHLCRVRRCVNPAHLEAVTARENMRRALGLPMPAQLDAMRRPPTHPGEMFLEEVLKPLGYGAQTGAAKRMGMSLNRLNEIVTAKRPVTPDSAILMGAVSGTAPALWMRLQADYDLWHALQETDVSAVKPFDRKEYSPLRD